MKVDDPVATQAPIRFGNDLTQLQEMKQIVLEENPPSPPAAPARGPYGLMFLALAIIAISLWYFMK